MLFTLSGCSSSTSNKTDDITETKTFLYNYDYETDSNGEVHTDYHFHHNSHEIYLESQVIAVNILLQMYQRKTAWKQLNMLLRLYIHMHPNYKFHSFSHM